MSNNHTTYAPGLEGVIAAETRLSAVDGAAGRLTIAGFPLEELASSASFPEVLYLLWHDRLPDATALADLRERLAAKRPLPPPLLDLLRAAAARAVPAMDALRMAVAALDLDEGNGGVATAAETAVARFPVIVAAYWRLRHGEEPLAPDPDLDHAANYLYMLSGERPSRARARALETYLNAVCDHGLNASTFTARVIISTQSDPISALAGAVGALKGPWHGGAPGPALDTVFAIGEAGNAEPYLRRKLDAGERLMGFGHRVYKVRDPRAELLAEAAARLYRADGDMALYELAKTVEETAVRLLEEYKPGRNLQTNVEFYTALLLHGVGLPSDLFSPTFAVGRVAGWTAHIREQVAAGRLIRPRAAYAGEYGRSWVPLAERKASEETLHK